MALAAYLTRTDSTRGKTGFTKLLGVRYNTDSDEFLFEISPEPKQKLTKQELVSEVHKIYDPLGLSLPVLLKAKQKAKCCNIKERKLCEELTTASNFSIFSRILLYFLFSLILSVQVRSDPITCQNGALPLNRVSVESSVPNDNTRDVRDVDADDADADDVGADADIEHRELDAGLPYAEIEDDVEVREAEEIHANEDFIEPIDELDVGGIGPENVIVAVEDIHENADMAGPMDQPDHEEIGPEEVLVVADEVDGDLDQHDAARRRQGIVDQGPDDRDVIEELFLRLRRTSQERDDLQMMINELELQERCAPRRYREGVIRRRDEFGMPCVFCEALGHHYSDSCLEVMDTQERKRILRETGRCKQCLDRGCEGGDDCRKKDARCRYCSKKGHNPAICSLPERSRDIEDQLEVLRRNHEDASNRVLRIRRKLRRHGVDI